KDTSMTSPVVGAGIAVQDRPPSRVRASDPRWPIANARDAESPLSSVKLPLRPPSTRDHVTPLSAETALTPPVPAATALPGDVKAAASVPGAGAGSERKLAPPLAVLITRSPG